MENYKHNSGLADNICDKHGMILFALTCLMVSAGVCFIPITMAIAATLFGAAIIPAVIGIVAFKEKLPLPFLSDNMKKLCQQSLTMCTAACGTCFFAAIVICDESIIVSGLLGFFGALLVLICLFETQEIKNFTEKEKADE